MNKNTSELPSSRWQVTHLGKDAIATFADQAPPSLEFSADGMSASGHGSCNRFRAAIILHFDSLRFGPLMSTFMACPEGMQQEAHYLSALAQVNSYRLNGQTLELLDSEARVVVVLAQLF